MSESIRHSTLPMNAGKPRAGSLVSASILFAALGIRACITVTDAVVLGRQGESAIGLTAMKLCAWAAGTSSDQFLKTSRSAGISAGF
jgi:hypothetical protein